MTLKTTLQLGATFTDTTLPKDRIDPVLPDAGALLLIDLAHPTVTNPTGVPADAALTIPNVAATQALAVMGSSTANDAVPIVTNLFGAVTGSQGKIERTGKGGIHTINSQASDPTANAAFKLAMSTAMKAYVYNNPTHAFYFSAWAYFTRQIGATAGFKQDFAEIVSATASTSNVRTILSANNQGTAAAGGATGRSPAGTVGAAFANNESKGWAGTAPASAASMITNLMIGGVAGVVAGSALLRQAKGSLINYRMYVEDLTVSGRTYAQVDALDFAQYTKDVLTPGGRFYGDTFTDPTTIP